MLCCAILHSFSALLCCANMDWPIDYGWRWTVWADRCLGLSCWAAFVLTGGLGWMDPCSRASRGGGPKSRTEPGSETVMRGTMCQDWQNSHTTCYLHQYPVLLISPHLFFTFFLPLTLLTSFQTVFFPHFLIVVLLSCSALHPFQPSASYSFSSSHFFPPFHPRLDRLFHKDMVECMHVFVTKLQLIVYLPLMKNLNSFLKNGQTLCFSNQ